MCRHDLDLDGGIRAMELLGVGWVVQDAAKDTLVPAEQHKREAACHSDGTVRLRPWSGKRSMVGDTFGLLR